MWPLHPVLLLFILPRLSSSSLLIDASSTHSNTLAATSPTNDVNDRLSSLVIGVDVGTESARVGVFTLNGTLVAQTSSPYRTYYPASGHVEQLPSDWWACIGDACRRVIAENSIDIECIKGLCVDNTACSVVLLDSNKAPISPCILYCDARSAPQTRAIIEMARGDPSLRVCNDGLGPISAEWMIPKCTTAATFYHLAYIDIDVLL
jgi:ribulose kinase